MDKIFTFQIPDILDNNTKHYEKLTKEERMLTCYCNDHPASIHHSIYPDNYSIPVGNLDWCTKFYGHTSPNYYPTFLKKYLYRNVWLSNYGAIRQRSIPTFIRPAYQYDKWRSHIFQYHIIVPIYGAEN